MAKRTSTRKSQTKTASPTFDGNVRLCVLSGPEYWLRQQYLQSLKQALEQAHGEVEVFTYDGETASLSDILDELRSYALMQQYKIVLLDAADAFLKREGFREAMERYAQNPVDHATLVMRCDTWRKSKLDKLIEQHGLLIKCEPFNAPQAKAWLIERCRSEHGREITPDAASLLVERMGTDLLPLDSELAKLALMVDTGKKIDRNLVAELVGRSSDEEAWKIQQELLAGMSSGSPGRLLEKLHELVDIAGNANELVTWHVSDVMRKLNVAAMMRHEGASDAAIGKALKLWGPNQSLFLGVLRRMRPESLDEVFRDVLEGDRLAKSGFGNLRRNLECFCVRLADKVK
ncbi:MAG: hypothetical protein Kow00105_06290 [Phycisphaeraceae bacterium]